jgi:hypothetical protein
MTSSYLLVLLLEFLGGNTLAEARAEDVIPHEHVGTTFFRFATRLAVIGRGNRLNGAKIRLPEANLQNGHHPVRN